jgi:nicotinate-nucleotide pyrophosphorylase (carboxylating)
LPDRFAGDLVRRALEEDDARRDVTTALLGDRGDAVALGRSVAEAACVVAGGPVAGEVFRQLDPSVRFEQHIPEGGRAEKGDLIATAHGPARSLLAGERVALNFLQRLTGIATATRRAVDAVAGTGAIITDTRKTTPGLRAQEKYAVRMGGGENHRLSLADAVLWKDNHWELLERTGRSLAELLRSVPDGMAVTVEVENEEQLEAALKAGVKRILVDNQPPERLARWVKRAAPAAIEASGGITPETVARYAKAGARYISMGALTHSAPAAAIRLDLQLAK